jgi:hypothetical protein
VASYTWARRGVPVSPVLPMRPPLKNAALLPSILPICLREAEGVRGSPLEETRLSTHSEHCLRVSHEDDDGNSMLVRQHFAEFYENSLPEFPGELGGATASESHRGDDITTRYPSVSSVAHALPASRSTSGLRRHSNISASSDGYLSVDDVTDHP